MEVKRITPLKAIRLKCLGKDENGYCGAENSGTISDFSEDAMLEG